MKKILLFTCLILLCFQALVLVAAEKKKTVEKEYIQAYRQKISEFANQLSNTDPRIRQQAALNLIDMKKKRLVAEEVSAYLSHQKLFARERAAFILGELGPASKEALPLLLKVGKEESDIVALSAITAIGKIQKDFTLPQESQKRLEHLLEIQIKNLTSKDFNKRNVAIIRLSYFDGYKRMVFNELRPLLENKEISPELFIRIISRFGPFPDADSYVKKILQEANNRKLITHTLDAMLAMKCRDIPEKKLVKIYNKYPMLADHVIQIFSLSRSKESVLALADIIINSKDDTAASRACEQLKKVGIDGFPAVPVMVKSIGRLGYYRTKLIVSALGAIGKCTTSGVKILSMLAVNSKQKEMRQFASYSLGQIDKIDKDFFRKMLTERSAVARMSALAAAEVIGPPMAAVLDEIVQRLSDVEKGIPKKAAMALAAIGERASPALDVLYKKIEKKKISDEVAGAVGYAIAKISGKKALPRLRELFELTDPDKRYLCVRIIHVIQNIGPEAKEAVPMLVDALIYSNKRRYQDIFSISLNALCAIGPEAEEAIPALNDLRSGIYRESIEYTIKKIKGIVK